MSNKRLDRYVQFANRVFGIDPSSREAVDIAMEGIQRFKDFLSEIGVPVSLKEASIPIDEIEDIVSDVVKISFSSDGKLSCIPPVDRDEILEVFKEAI